eukprot:CAMPEP_0202877482 /NCGR_PEP_ID=MMETSP1391-20130828/30716_1 /ASSEMBLY_ACC=CAM_ASM_000867 /TAXON_ID=1034604 /ORGANISM="Chlamydomonas leiostraca, Strain SAG 11-49" /LENGTH=297 /DNA_ID=CAMNT_0049559527 /DNA_START=59 /DNA_END=952 /DNA_ORIENTATION=+
MTLTSRTMSATSIGSCKYYDDLSFSEYSDTSALRSWANRIRSYRLTCTCQGNSGSCFNLGQSVEYFFYTTTFADYTGPDDTGSVTFERSYCNKTQCAVWGPMGEFDLSVMSTALCINWPEFTPREIDPPPPPPSRPPPPPPNENVPSMTCTARFAVAANFPYSNLKNAKILELSSDVITEDNEGYCWYFQDLSFPGTTFESWDNKIRSLDLTCTCKVTEREYDCYSKLAADMQIKVWTDPFLKYNARTTLDNYFEFWDTDCEDNVCTFYTNAEYLGKDFDKTISAVALCYYYTDFGP